MVSAKRLAELRKRRGKLLNIATRVRNVRAKKKADVMEKRMLKREIRQLKLETSKGVIARSRRGLMFLAMKSKDPVIRRKAKNALKITKSGFSKFQKLLSKINTKL